MISRKISLLAIGYNYLEINKIQDDLSREFLKIHFDFAISIRDSIYRLNISEYEIILLDLTSSEMDCIEALREIYQKSKGKMTLVTVNAEDIVRITDAFDIDSHLYIVKNGSYIETLVDSIRNIIAHKSEINDNNIRLTSKDRPIFQQLANTIHDHLFVVGLDFRIKMVNEKLVKRFNCSAEEIIGKHCYEIFYQFDKPCSDKSINCPLENIMKTNEPCQLTHTHHSAVNNQMIKTHISAIPLTNEFNSAEEVMIVLKDEKMSLATPFDKSLLQELVDGLSEGLFFCDAENKIVMLNHAAESLLNIEKQKLIGKSIFELPLGEGLHWLDNILQNREEQNRLTKLDKIKVQQKWLSLRFVPIFENNQRYMGGFLYLTEKQYEPIISSFDSDIISVSKLFSAKIVAEG